MASELQKYNEQSKLSKWAEMVRTCRESGLSVGRWCAENGVPVSTYYVRQRKVYAAVQEEATSSGFYEVPTGKATEVSAAPIAALCRGEITANIYPTADEKAIMAIIRALRSC